VTRKKPRKAAARPGRVSSAYMIRSVLIVAGLAVLMGLLSSVAMGIFNRKFGIEHLPEEFVESPETYPDTLRIAHFTPGEFDLTSEDIARWDSRWEVSPCSVFVTADSPPVLDTIPTADTPSFIPVETHFLLESWGRASGLNEAELERFWVFNNYDTLYVDMPRSLDLGGLKKTVESRFVCYTLLVPMINGQPMESAGTGIRLAGVPGVFPRR